MLLGHFGVMVMYQGFALVENKILDKNLVFDGASF
jgi:hypothetical protein